LKRIIFVLCLVLLILASLNYSGFCFKEMRYLSDSEKVKIVFNYQNSREFLPLERSLPKHIRYESFEQYLRLYPNCCTVGSDGFYDVPPSSFIDRILGYDSRDIVVINFNVRYLDKFGHQQVEKAQFENVLTNCGDIKY
jgi:hypothetical protein